jgi:membrane protein implicated in regulation of membrane protease activity
VSYVVPSIPGAVFLGAVLLPLIVPPFALILLVVVALAALAALIALAGAVLATPYLLVRFLRRRLAEPRRSTEGSRPVARVIAQAGRATLQSGVVALANSTTARRSQ